MLQQSEQDSHNWLEEHHEMHRLIDKVLDEQEQIEAWLVDVAYEGSGG